MGQEVIISTKFEVVPPEQGGIRITTVTAVPIPETGRYMHGRVHINVGDNAIPTFPRTRPVATPANYHSKP